MEDKSKIGQARHLLRADLERIDSHGGDQPELDDLDLEGAKKHGDPIPRDADSTDPQLPPRPPNPGVIPAGGYFERTSEPKKK